MYFAYHRIAIARAVERPQARVEERLEISTLRRGDVLFLRADEAEDVSLARLRRCRRIEAVLLQDVSPVISVHRHGRVILRMSTRSSPRCLLGEHAGAGVVARIDVAAVRDPQSSTNFVPTARRGPVAQRYELVSHDVLWCRAVSQSDSESGATRQVVAARRAPRSRRVRGNQRLEPRVADARVAGEIGQGRVCCPRRRHRRSWSRRASEQSLIPCPNISTVMIRQVGGGCADVRGSYHVRLRRRARADSRGTPRAHHRGAR
jgi:hypothetical protein